MTSWHAIAGQRSMPDTLWLLTISSWQQQWCCRCFYSPQITDPHWGIDMHWCQSHGWLGLDRQTDLELADVLNWTELTADQAIVPSFWVNQAGIWQYGWLSCGLPSRTDWSDWYSIDSLPDHCCLLLSAACTSPHFISSQFHNSQLFIASIGIGHDHIFSSHWHWPLPLPLALAGRGSPWVHGEVCTMAIQEIPMWAWWTLRTALVRGAAQSSPVRMASYETTALRLHCRLPLQIFFIVIDLNWSNEAVHRLDQTDDVSSRWNGDQEHLQAVPTTNTFHWKALLRTDGASTRFDSLNLFFSNSSN